MPVVGLTWWSTSVKRGMLDSFRSALEALFESEEAMVEGFLKKVGKQKPFNQHVASYAQLQKNSVLQPI